MESAWHPKQAVLWFMGATLIAESRVKLDRHRASDVIFGAGIGFAAAQWELSRPRGLLLSPLIKEDGEVVGVKMTAVF
jgi:membrane-associated phospholipid phosphatase